MDRTIYKLPEDIVGLLKHYVYVYRDPRTGKPFYVGKGKGERMFQHLREMAETEKVKLIREIRDVGLEPAIEVLRYGLSEDQALLVEAAAIDLVGKHELTNRMAGGHKGSFGMVSSKEIVAMARREPVEFYHSVLMVSLNKSYRSNMSETELYEFTRGIWRLDVNRAQNAELVMPVYQGIIRGVFRPNTWHEAGTTEYTERDFDGSTPFCGRWEFVGERADDLLDRYLDKYVGPFGQNPIRYFGV